MDEKELARLQMFEEDLIFIFADVSWIDAINEVYEVE